MTWRNVTWCIAHYYLRKCATVYIMWQCCTLSHVPLLCESATWLNGQHWHINDMTHCHIIYSALSSAQMCCTLCDSATGLKDMTRRHIVYSTLAQKAQYYIAHSRRKKRKSHNAYTKSCSTIMWQCYRTQGHDSTSHNVYSTLAQKAQYGMARLCTQERMSHDALHICAKSNGWVLSHERCHWVMSYESFHVISGEYAQWWTAHFRKWAVHFCWDRQFIVINGSFLQISCHCLLECAIYCNLEPISRESDINICLVEMCHLL